MALTPEQIQNQINQLEKALREQRSTEWETTVVPALQNYISSYGSIYFQTAGEEELELNKDFDFETLKGTVGQILFGDQNIFDEEKETNLIQNGEFDNSSLTGWTVGTGSTPPELSEDEYYAGSKSLILKTSQTICYNRNDISLNPNSNYALSFYCKAPREVTQLTLKAGGTSSTPTITQTIDLPDNHDSEFVFVEWQNITNINNIFIAFTRFDTKADNVYIDSIVFEETPVIETPASIAMNTEVPYGFVTGATETPESLKEQLETAKANLIAANKDAWQELVNNILITFINNYEINLIVQNVDLSLYEIGTDLPQYGLIIDDDSNITVNDVNRIMLYDPNAITEEDYVDAEEDDEDLDYDDSKDEEIDDTSDESMDDVESEETNEVEPLSEDEMINEGEVLEETLEEEYEEEIE